MSFTLETDRLTLRPFEQEDAHRIRDLANDKQLASILGLPYPYTIQHAQEWFGIQSDQINNGTEYPLAIISKEISEIIGTITLRIDKGNNKGELGYWIGREYWGRGFATEAIDRIIQFGFSHLNLNKIWASVVESNMPSSHVLKRNGLNKEGILLQDRLLNDEYVDIHVYGLLKGEYQNEKKNRKKG